MRGNAEPETDGREGLNHLNFWQQPIDLRDGNSVGLSGHLRGFNFARLYCS